MCGKATERRKHSKAYRHRVHFPERPLEQTTLTCEKICGDQKSKDVFTSALESTNIWVGGCVYVLILVICYSLFG
jgi:hypothetical protein